MEEQEAKEGNSVQTVVSQNNKIAKERGWRFISNKQQYAVRQRIGWNGWHGIPPGVLANEGNEKEIPDFSKEI